MQSLPRWESMDRYFECGSTVQDLPGPKLYRVDNSDPSKSLRSQKIPTSSKQPQAIPLLPFRTSHLSEADAMLHAHPPGHRLLIFALLVPYKSSKCPVLSIDLFLIPWTAGKR